MTLERAQIAKIDLALGELGLQPACRCSRPAAVGAQRVQPRTPAGRGLTVERSTALSSTAVCLPVRPNTDAEGRRLHSDEDVEAAADSVRERHRRHCQLEQSEGDFRRFASVIHQV